MIKRLEIIFLFILIFSLVNAEITFFEDPNAAHIITSSQQEENAIHFDVQEIFQTFGSECIKDIKCNVWSLCEEGVQKRDCWIIDFSCKKANYIEERACGEKSEEKATLPKKEIWNKVFIVLILALIVGVSFWFKNRGREEN